MLVPSTVTNEVEPPSGGGATYHQVAVNAAAAATTDRTMRVRAKRRRTDGIGTTTVDIVTALRRP